MAKKVLFGKAKYAVRGEAFFPSLDVPDTYSKLTCRVVAPTEIVTPILKKAYAEGKALFPELDAWSKPANRKQIAPVPWKPAVDKDGEEIEGMTLVNINRPGTTSKGVEASIKVIDAKTGEPIENKAIYGGSEVSVGFSVKAWFSPTAGGFGVSLNLELVVVHKAHYGSSHNVEDYGIELDAEPGDDEPDYVGDEYEGMGDTSDNMPDDDIPF